MTGFYGNALKAPQVAVSESLKLSQEVMRFVMDASTVGPMKGDKRWRDPVWMTNPAYRVMMRSYLSWRRGIEDGSTGFRSRTVTSSGPSFWPGPSPTHLRPRTRFWATRRR